MTENQVATIVVDAAYKVHTTLGPGLLESVYTTVMAYELQKRGLRVERERPVAIVYDNVRLNLNLRMDLLVEDLLIIELKSIEAIAPVHKKQPLTYLRLANKRLGLSSISVPQRSRRESTES